MIPGSASQFFLGASQAAGGATGFQVSRSLRYNAPDSSYLSRTFSVSGNRKTWSWSGWVKRSGFGSDQMIFTSRPTASPYALFYFTSADYLQFSDSTFGYIRTASVFRDPSAWYHILLSVDTTGATAADYLKIYVNNVRQTIGASTLPSQNSEGQINTATAHSIGSPQPYASTEYFDGYVAQAQFIDGQALTPSSFTEVSATTGQLIPKAYSGTYGTNGFYLQFADNSNNTATTLGKDTSGNGNNWTPNNLSVTAGAGNDSLVDTPTSYGTDTGVGGEVRGNYATWNAVNKSANTTLSNGNLNATSAVADWRAVLGTIGMSSGKWYWEQTITGSALNMHGIAKQGANLDAFIGADANGWGYYGNSGTYNNSNLINTSTFASYTGGDVIGIAFDADNGSLYFYKNGTVQNSGSPAYTGLTSGPYFPAASHFNSSSSDVNFGQRPFAYQTPGTNRPAATFLALCDTNLGAPLVAKPNTLMDVKLWTGNASTQSITGLGFSPDLVWVKGRSQAYGHRLLDVVRGATNALASSSTAAEFVESTGLTAFNSDGFSLGADASYNDTATTYVGWCWDAGTSTVTNTQGSITGGAQVRANPSAGFSVATWTGDAISTATVGHGLGVAPAFYIIKSRNNATNWGVYHIGIGPTQYLLLNSTSAAQTSTAPWNNTAPTSTVYSIGDASFSNVSGYTYVGYAFSPVVGYSSFGSYVGTGSSTDSPFVYTGFRTRFLLIKTTADISGNWYILDTARDTVNVMPLDLYANDSSAESTVAANQLDIVSNGFKLRSAGGGMNGSGHTLIYAAFAESPFQYARAR